MAVVAFDDAMRTAMADCPDAASFMLRHARRTDWPLRALAEHLRCLPTARRKLPRLTAAGGRFDHLAVQQCSSEACAAVAAAVAGPVGDGMDLCCGLGIDSAALAARSSTWTACELDPERAALATHNLHTLGSRAQVVAGDGIAALAAGGRPLDLLFADPARRDGDGRKTARLAGSMPDVVRHAGLLRERARRVLLKLAPGADRDEVRRAFPGLSRWVVVGSDGEAKQVLALVDGGPATVEVRIADAAHAALIGDGRPDPAPVAPDHPWIGRLHPAVVTAGAGGACARAHGWAWLGGGWVAAAGAHPAGPFARWWRCAGAHAGRPALERLLRGRHGGACEVFVQDASWDTDELRRRFRLRAGGGAAVLVLGQLALDLEPSASPSTA